MVKSVLCACALLFALVIGHNPDSKVVHTSQGPVRGYKEDGLFAFYSIPYATAPTGVHKFKPPTAPPVWLDTFEAIQKNIICPQGSLSGVRFDGNVQENCLIANVFVSDTDEKNLPVLVNVHGGAYQIGSGNLLAPKSLVKNRNIIAVTFNYRLGAHGFLCLGTKDAPGNAGMKDAVALLRWVKKNIASFGGNPDDVTISGQSAGSSAVDLIQLSKSARGLFNKVIPESGSNLGVWSVQQDPIRHAQEFARKLQFENTDDLNALEEFYKNLSLDELFSDVFLDRMDSTFVFVPCVEKDTKSNIFLDESPLNILKKGDYEKLPMLYGFANMEGIFRLAFVNVEEWIKGMNQKFSDFLPADLKFNSEEEKEEVAQSIKEFYFGDKPVGVDNIQGYVNYFTDVVFAYPTLRSIKLQLEAGNDKIYLYEYSYVGEVKGISSAVTEKYNVHGADHCAQSVALYVESGVQGENTVTEKTKKVQAFMKDLWLNFISTGAPVPPGSSYPEWPPVSKAWGPYMSLNETLELRGSLLEERARFLDSIYDKYYFNPIPPFTSPKHSEL